MSYALVDYTINITKVAPDQLIFQVNSSFDIIPILVPIITAVAGGIIALIIFLAQRKQQDTLAESQRKLQRISTEYQAKQLEITSMLDVFKILNSPKHRLAREIVYCAYHLYREGDKHVFEKEPYHSAAAMIRADMDQMGLLIGAELLDESLFLKAYWNTVLVTWKALKDNIQQQKLARKDYPSYMDNFKELNDKALKYRDKYKLGSGDVNVFHKEDCAKKFNNENIID